MSDWYRWSTKEKGFLPVRSQFCLRKVSDKICLFRIHFQILSYFAYVAEVVSDWMNKFPWASLNIQHTNALRILWHTVLESPFPPSENIHHWIKAKFAAIWGCEICLNRAGELVECQSGWSLYLQLPPAAQYEHFWFSPWAMCHHWRLLKAETL